MAMRNKGLLGNMIFGIISLAIVVIVLASVFITTVKTTNTTSWTAGEVALWGTVTLVAIAGFVYSVAAVFGLV
jgi:hypothetical protein